MEPFRAMLIMSISSLCVLGGQWPNSPRRVRLGRQVTPLGVFAL